MDEIRDKIKWEEEARSAEVRWMEGVSEKLQGENDDRSGKPMGLVSVNNLHISVDSFKSYGSLSGYNVASGILNP